MFTKKNLKNKINRILKPVNIKEFVSSIWSDETKKNNIKPQKPDILIKPLLPLKKPRKFLKKLSNIQKEHVDSNFNNQNSHTHSKNLNHIRLKYDSHKLIKHPNNPIIIPNNDNWWESFQVFNPGAIEIEGKIHMIYRSIGVDGESRLGYANSSNGFDVHYRLSYPVYKHKMTANNSYYENSSGGSWGGAEDPRLVRVENEDVIYMTYTAVDNGIRVGLTCIKVDDFKNQKWNWSLPKLISRPDEIHKNWVIFPQKINGKYAILHSISPKISIEYLDNLDFKKFKYIESFHYKYDHTRSNKWDSLVRGVGPPPIKTQYGWLILYHAMNKYNPSQYLLGAMLLDLNEPTKVLHRSVQPILVPEELYENQGFKTGVIYASGAVIKDGNLIIYYGGADSYVCVAFVNFNEFLNKLVSDEQIKMNNSIIPTINFKNVGIDNIKNQIKQKIQKNFAKNIN